MCLHCALHRLQLCFMEIIIHTGRSGKRWKAEPPNRCVDSEPNQPRYTKPQYGKITIHPFVCTANLKINQRSAGVCARFHKHSFILNENFFVIAI